MPKTEQWMRDAAQEIVSRHLGYESTAKVIASEYEKVYPDICESCGQEIIDGNFSLVCHKPSCIESLTAHAPATPATSDLHCDVCGEVLQRGPCDETVIHVKPCVNAPHFKKELWEVAEAAPTADVKCPSCGATLDIIWNGERWPKAWSCINRYCSEHKWHYDALPSPPAGKGSITVSSQMGNGEGSQRTCNPQSTLQVPSLEILPCYVEGLKTIHRGGCGICSLAWVAEAAPATDSRLPCYYNGNGQLIHRGGCGECNKPPSGQGRE